MSDFDTDDRPPGSRRFERHHGTNARMLLGPYRLVSLLGSGRDGASYQARRIPGDDPVEVWVLGPARAMPELWPEIARRLRLAALLEHTSLRGILQVELDEGSPYVALEPDEPQRLEAILHPDQPLPVWEVLELAGQLIEALSLAHRVGLVHGRLGPSAIGWNAETRRVSLDLADLEVRQRPAPKLGDLEHACRAPELQRGQRPGCAADIYSLGVLIHTLLVGQPPSPERVPVVDDLFAKELLAWAGSLRRPEPEDRPPAQEAMLHLPHPTWTGSEAGDPVHRTIDWVERNQGNSAALVDPPDLGLPENLKILASLSNRAAPHHDTTRRSPTNKRSTATTPVVKVPPDGTPPRDPDLDAVSQMSRGPIPAQIGRFKLEGLLGEGGLGRVYRAVDLADGNVVAIKVLHPHLMRHAHAVRRFRKEARLLAEVRSPRIANLLESGEENGIHYLALEFVQGRTLADVLRHSGPMNEDIALILLVELAHALAEPHRRGIIHRDIKPENVMLVGEQASESVVPRIKLLDFGLARHVLENDSLEMTREGAAVGTVLYMAPEQARDSTKIDCRADIYSLGCTLYHLLTGKPPYLGDNALSVQMQHASAPIPPLRQLNLPIGEGLVQIVERCLAKLPQDRFADAGELLAALARLQRGEASTIEAHPALPRGRGRVLTYEWTFELQASPEALWPLVADTDRINQAVGVPAVHFTTRPDWRGGSQTFGEFRVVGLTQRWREHPFEWVEGRRYGVVREYSQGVFHSFYTTVSLNRRTDGGTTLVHRVEVEPRGFLGRIVAAIEIGIKGKRACRRVYERIDRYLSGSGADHDPIDPYADPKRLARDPARRLDDLLVRLGERGIAARVIEHLGEWLRSVPEQRLARIRPLALARELSVDPDELTAAFLHGARDGLFVLLWDLLCPICRIAADVKSALRDLEDHGHCPACNLDFAVDFTSAVEMIFRIHPSIRASELRTYCVGGPFHAPHVVAQVRLKPGEPLQLDVSLSEGNYIVRGPQLPGTVLLRVHPEATAQRVEVLLGVTQDVAPSPMRPGRQQIVLVNDHPRELVVRLERTIAREDALTAARASSLALFRGLFPQEVLAPGKLASVAQASFVLVRLAEPENVWRKLGDGSAFSLLHDLLRHLEEIVRREGGAVVQSGSDGGLAAFTDPVAAVRVAAELLHHDVAAGIKLRVAVHRGPALAATLNDRLSYFGATVRQVERLADLVPEGGAVLSQAMVEDAQAGAWLRERGYRLELAPVETPPEGVGIPHQLLPRTDTL